MNKPQTILIGVGGVLGIVLVGSIYLVLNSVSAASESAEKLEKMQRDYARIFKTANPFPNAENMEILEKNSQKAKKWEQNLLNIIREGEYSPESKQTNPGYFSNKRQEMIERLTTTAPKGPDGKSVAVEGLTFGFDKYKEGAPASKSDVPRLMKQLTFIDGLVQLLYNAEIDKLKAVRREEFENASNTNEEESTTRRSSRRRRSSASSSSTVNSGGSVVIEPYEQGVVETDRQRFEFVFDAKQDSLLKVLNAIGEMKPYAIVSKLSFVKAADDYHPPVEENKVEKKSNRRSRNEEEIEEQSPAGIINVRPPSRTTRLVSGALREAPVTVTMTVDVFTFIPEKDSVVEEEDSEEVDESLEVDTENDESESNEGF